MGGWKRKILINFLSHCLKKTVVYGGDSINLFLKYIFVYLIERLNVEPDVVQNAVTGIMHLLIEASKNMVCVHKLNKLFFSGWIYIFGEI